MDIFTFGCSRRLNGVPERCLLGEDTLGRKEISSGSKKASEGNVIKAINDVVDRAETRKPSYKAWMSGVAAIYDHVEDSSTKRRVSSLRSHFSVRKFLRLKSILLHVKPSKKEVIIIAWERI